MKTLKQFLLENLDFDSHGVALIDRVAIHRNPHWSTVKGMIQDSSYHKVRLFVGPSGEYYVWDSAASLFHAALASKMNLRYSLAGFVDEGHVLRVHDLQRYNWKVFTSNMSGKPFATILSRVRGVKSE